MNQPRLMMLVAALAAGAATAASPGTTAGTQIRNVASATFTDPYTGSTITAPVLSNEVVTTVTPIPGFDIVYAGGQPDGTTATTPAPAYDIANVSGTSSTPTTYTVVNNSNINNYVVNLTADTTGSPTTLPSGNVKYYPAGTTNFVPANEITKVTLPVDGQVNIIQVITITGATAGQQFSASPRGNAPASTDTAAYPTPPATGAFSAYAESSNVNTPVTAGDLQFTRVTVATPTLSVTPPTDTTPSTPTVTPPGPGTYPGTGGPTPDPNTYTPPSNPGNPSNPGTTITVDPATGFQNAYPKADPDTQPDVVTFVGTVTNQGSASDTIIIKPLLPSGATSVTVLDANGNVLPIDPVTGGYILPGGAVAPGGSIPFQVVVTYPDSDLTPGTVNTPIAVPIEVYSGTVPSSTPVDTATLTIFTPDMQFGNTVGTAPTGVPDATISTVEEAVPGGATNTTVGTTTDGSAVFRVSVRNTGAYADSYTLAGSVPIRLTDGTTVSVPVTYYNANGSALTTPGTTGVIASGASSDYLAVVNIPANAAATTGTTGANPQPSLSQLATGAYSTDTAADTNDQIRVPIVNTNTDPVTGNPNSGMDIDKYQTVQPAGGPAVAPPTPTVAQKNPVTALPGDTVRYAIIAKNNFNAPIAGFRLSERNGRASDPALLSTANLFTHTNFVSAQVTLSGFSGQQNVYYSVNDGVSWTPIAANTSFTPAVSPADGLMIAVDTNAVAGIDADDLMPSGASIRLDLTVTVR